MPLLRRFALLAALAAGSAVLAGPAFGAAARPSGVPNTLDSTHFRVHYQGDRSSSWSITQTQAGDILGWAERAYSHYAGLGYTAPANDGVLGGDARTDIYVVDWSSTPAKYGQADWDADTNQSSGFLTLAGNEKTKGIDQITVAHEVFEVFAFAVWTPWGASHITDRWFWLATAEWMGYRVNEFNADHPVVLGPEDMALDCRDEMSTNKCDLTVSSQEKNEGHTRWSFFEYVSETYGPTVVKDTLAAGSGGAVSATTALGTALAGKGTTLADVYNNWASAHIRSAYSVKALQEIVPNPYKTLQTGSKAGAVATVHVPVNHLSTRVLKVDRGDGSTTLTCYPAALTIDVTVPAGTLSKPVFYWTAPNNAAVTLTVSGTKATATVPWDTCTWTGVQGYLALPNASLNVDGAVFDVSLSMTVDSSSPVATEKPPTPVTPSPKVVAVGSASFAPSISVFGPELLTLAAGESQVRLIVESNGQGIVQAKFGSLTLGTARLRSGNNDVRFTLPAGVVSSLRTSAAKSGSLTLTPLSADGAVAGQPVAQRLRITPAAATAKPKAKPSTKPKPKAKAKTKKPKTTLRRK
jgi:hypothetical protein